VGRGEESGTFRPLSGCLEKRGLSPLQIARALLTQGAAGRYIRPLLRRWRGTDMVRLGYAITDGHNLSSGHPLIFVPRVLEMGWPANHGLISYPR